MKLLIGITLSVLLSCSTLQSQITDWTLTLKNGSRSGLDLENVSLVSVVGDTLTVRERRTERRIQVDSIIAISRSVDDSRALRSAAIGAGILGGAGLFVGQLLWQDLSAQRSSYQYDKNDGSELKVILPVVGLVAGAGIGAILAPQAEVISYDLHAMKSQEKTELLRSILDNKAGVVTVQPQTTGNVQRNVVYLKNGSIIRGTVIEMVPDSLIKLRTADSSLFVFKTSEVEKIVGEEMQHGAAPVTAKPAAEVPPETEEDLLERRVVFTISGGVGCPVGSLASENGSEAGHASLGFAFRGELNYPIDNHTGWISSVSGSFNGVNIPNAPGSVEIGSFTSVFVGTGIQVGRQYSAKVSPYMQAQLGLFLGGYPSITSSSYNEPSAAATSVGYSFGVGMKFNRKVNVSVNYMSGKPEFTLTASGGGMTATGRITQPMSVILIALGVLF